MTATRFHALPLLCLAVLALLVIGVIAGPEARAQNTPLEEQHEQLRVMLENIRVDLDYDEAALKDVIEDIIDRTDLNIVIDREVLEDVEDEEITIGLSNLTVKSALGLILSFVELTYTFKHGVIWITTPERAFEGTSVMRVYDVRDIIMRIKNFPGEQIDLGAGGSQQGGIVFMDNDEEPSIESIELDDLIDLIPEVAAPNSWDMNPDANILQVNGVLVIYQTPEAHREIAALLDLLRSGR